MLTRQQVLYGLERVELRSTSIFDSCPLKSRDARQEVGIILQNVSYLLSPAIWSQSTSPSSYPWGDQYQLTTTLGTTELNNRAKFVIFSVFFG